MPHCVCIFEGMIVYMCLGNLYGLISSNIESVLTVTPQGKFCYYPHFADEKIEYQKDITCPKAHCW